MERKEGVNKRRKKHRELNNEGVWKKKEKIASKRKTREKLRRKNRKREKW